MVGCSAGKVKPPGIEDGGAGKVYTIKQLRDRSLKARPADGATVLIHNGVITAIRNKDGFYMREGKGAHEAILVYTAGSQPMDTEGHPLRVGDLVSVRGKLHSFNQTDELVKPLAVTVAGNGDHSPVSVKTSGLKPGSPAAEGMESHLVRVSGATVTALSSGDDSFWISDSPGQCDEAAPVCARVSDFFYDGGKKDGKPAVTVGAKLSFVTGVVNGFKDQHTLDVRDDKDLVP